MLKQIKFISIALFASLLIIGCNKNDDTNTSAAEGTERPSAIQDTTNDIAGMTEEEAITKWGEPELTQTHTIDALTVTFHEWKTEEGTVSIQFYNGEAKFSQLIPN
ncbi:hypothetical protein LCGC14_0612520 [marine sediment metagenome]|uniref:Lipoprotein n=1 Tax=marine sediment metagenome TaxID=412755 RepID=A0A0F9R7C8_9ZZZZ|nr:hypothetical protein [Methylophaga aminisulfidivorans]